MSRAFVKEPEGDQPGDDQPERPQSAHPNYITVEGLARLKQRLAEMTARRDRLEQDQEQLGARSELQSLRSEIRYLARRIEVAIPIEPARQGTDAIRFGATVDLLDGSGTEHRFTIVGEDEADAACNRISWVSPLATALLNRRAGDGVTWRRPAGNLELEVLDFRYR